MRELIINKKYTKRDEVIKSYFNSIKNYHLISAEREVELAQLIKEGNKDALNELVNANLRFVVSVAKQYSEHPPLTLIDYINEGNEGLIIAAKKFDETKGFKFISYAVWWIRQRIMALQSETKDTIRKPNNITQMQGYIAKFRNKYYLKNGFYPERLEIINELEISENEYKNCMKGGWTASGDKHRDNDKENLTLFQTIGQEDSENFKIEDLNIDLNRTITRSLSKRDADIVLTLSNLKKGSRVLLQEKYNITSYERIRQIYVKSLKKLRNSGGPVLEKYL